MDNVYLKNKKYSVEKEESLHTIQYNTIQYVAFAQSNSRMMLGKCKPKVYLLFGPRIKFIPRQHQHNHNE